jgi:hypothetical protein
MTNPCPPPIPASLLRDLAANIQTYLNTQSPTAVILPIPRGFPEHWQSEILYALQLLGQQS